MADAKPDTGATTPAVAPDGTQYDLPIASMEQAKAAGWTVDDPNETVPKQIETGALGFAHGLVPGAPSIIEAAGGPSVAEQKTLAKTNPFEYGGFKLAGAGTQAAGLAALTGGLGNALEAAPALAEGGEALAEGAGALMPAAEASGAVAEGADAASAAEAAGTTPGALSSAADTTVAQGPADVGAAQDLAGAHNLFQSGYTQQAVAGGVNNASDYINESELGDHQFNGEVLAQKIGLGALTGMAGAGAINIFRDSVAPKVISAADTALDALKKTGSKMFFKASDLVNSLAPGTTEAAGNAIAAGAKRITDSAAEDFASDANKVGDAMKSLGQAHAGEDGFRAATAEKNLADVSRATVLGGAPGSNGLLNTSAQIEQSLGTAQSLFDDGTFAGKGAFNTIKRELAPFQAALADPEATAADLHAAALDFKQAVGESGLFRNAVRGPEEQAGQQFLNENIWKPLQGVLRDKTVFGTEQAGRNAAFDAAARQKINAAKQVAKDFGAHELDLDSGKNELYLKASKIRGAFGGDPLANAEKVQHLNDYIDASKNYIDEIQKDAATAGAVAPGGHDLEALLDSVTKQRDAAAAYAPVQNLLRGVRQQAPLGLGAGGAAPIAGVAAHMLGADTGVVAPVVAGVAALRAPVKAMQMFAKISGAASTARDIIGSGVSKILGSQAGKAAITGASMSALRGLTVRDSSGNGSGTFARQAANISKLASDFEAQTQALGQNTSRLREVAPNTTMSLHMTGIAALQELAANIPKNPSRSMLPAENKNWEPPPDQLMAWNALHSAILKPETFLSACAKGTASPAVWQSLQKVYPKWSQQVQQAMVEHLSDHQDLTLTTAQKLCTSMIVGSPISPTVAPDQVAFQQSLYQQNATQAPAGGAPKKAPQHGLDKIDLGERSAVGGHRSR